MTAKITFFPVGNGDMTLIETDQGRKILIDCNIRKGEEHPDALTMLRDKLDRDDTNRLYVDLFIWSHPDEDHCRNIHEYFHLGAPGDWNSNDDLIFINEIWSSPIVYRRADRNLNLTDSAKAFRGEVKRRVKSYKASQNRCMTEGDYVLILGEDEDVSKTQSIPELVVKIDTLKSEINGTKDSSFEARILGPSPKADLDEDEEDLGKNHSSVILNIKLKVGQSSARLLTGGDAEVVCWEALFQRMKENNTLDYLNYEVLQVPHHCSWRSLSRDSSSDKSAAVSDDAINALNKMSEGAIAVSSSKTIKDNDDDPPSYKAKRKYIEILDPSNGQFVCVDDNKKNGKNEPLVIEITGDGFKLIPLTTLSSSGGNNKSSVNRRGGDDYA